MSTVNGNGEPVSILADWEKNALQLLVSNREVSLSSDNDPLFNIVIADLKYGESGLEAALATDPPVNNLAELPGVLGEEGLGKQIETNAAQVAAYVEQLKAANPQAAIFSALDHRQAIAEIEKGRRIAEDVQPKGA